MTCISQKTVWLSDGERIILNKYWRAMGRCYGRMDGIAEPLLRYGFACGCAIKLLGTIVAILHRCRWSICNDCMCAVQNLRH